MMVSELENHFTVFIRLPFNRGNFVDPPPVAWSAAKERELWEIISRQSKGHEIDWKALANQFEVTQPFLLQQAAWLYERQLSQVRAQMRRMSTRQSATASPIPPSTTASVVNPQATKRGGSISSRAPSRLSTQGTTITHQDANSPSTPVKSRFNLPNRPSSVAATVQSRMNSNSRPVSRKSSKEIEASSRTHSRRGSIQNTITKSPIELEPERNSPSEEDISALKTTGPRKSNPSTSHRRTSSLRKSQHLRQQSIGHVDEETEDEDSPAFLPFAQIDGKDDTINPNQDPSATLRGGLQQSPPRRPDLYHRSTSERIRHTTSTTNAMKTVTTEEHHQNLTSSASSNDAMPQPRRVGHNHGHGHGSSNPTGRHAAHPNSNLPTPLSPTQQAALAQAGLSPRSPRRRPNHTHTGSESSPSMGSSFSDLDDASVTQSALEEALMSGMGSIATTTGGVGGNGGLGSRVSGISQALRSRYFDARSGAGGGGGRGARGSND